MNLSGRQLGQADFLDRLTAIVTEAGVPPSALCLEVTAGSLVADLDPAWLVLRQAKQAGFQLALDDFGTGPSSLDALRHYAVDALKIDRSFIAHLDERAEDEAIVGHIIGLAHALGMTPIAEGVETPTEAQILTSLGCEAAQGYLFSTPQPAERIPQLLEARSGGAPGYIDLAALDDPAIERDPLRR